MQVIDAEEEVIAELVATVDATAEPSEVNFGALREP